MPLSLVARSEEVDWQTDGWMDVCLYDAYVWYLRYSSDNKKCYVIVYLLYEPGRKSVTEFPECIRIPEACLK
jgi:hypothetical protein